MKLSTAALGVSLTLWGSRAGPADGFQVSRLLRPSGPFAVGTTVRQWTDSTRLERFTGDPHDHRTLDVYIWYPAALHSGRSPTPYVPDFEGLERVMGSDYLARVGGVEGNSTVEPALSRRPALFPVVVLSHELGSLPMHYTILAEELASQGYLIAGINHSFGSAATVVGRRGAQPLHALWRSTFGVTLEAEGAWEDGVTEWAADIVFVVNQLTAEHRVGAEFFGNRLDLSQVFAVGHSLGGSAALLAGQLDPRIRGVVNLNGTARAAHTRFPVNIPVLWMRQDRSLLDSTAAARDLNVSVATLAAFLSRLDARRDTVMGRAWLGSYLASIGGVLPSHFSDLPVVFGQIPRRGGVLEPQRGMEIVRAYVVRFLAALIDRADPRELERLNRRYPEVDLVATGN